MSDLNFRIMDFQATKLDVLQKIMSVQKPSLLNKISQILDQEMIVGYTVNGDPLTKQAYNERLEQAEQQIKSGEFTDQSDLEREVESW